MFSRFARRQAALRATSARNSRRIGLIRLSCPSRSAKRHLPARPNKIPPVLARLDPDFPGAMLPLRNPCSRNASAAFRTAARSFRSHGRRAVILKIRDAKPANFLVVPPAAAAPARNSDRPDRARPSLRIVASHRDTVRAIGPTTPRYANGPADRGKCPRRRNSPRRRLQSANPGEMCGDSNRSAAIAAHSSRRTSRGNRRRFAAARAARRARQVPGIIRRARKANCPFRRPSRIPAHWYFPE